MEEEWIAGDGTQHRRAVHSIHIVSPSYIHSLLLPLTTTTELTD